MHNKCLWVCIAILFPLGCGTTGVGMPDPRLEVNDTLRQACPDTSDGLISALLIEVDAIREQGATRLDTLQIELNNCESGCDEACTLDPSTCDGAVQIQCREVCATCTAAIVDQVY